jgi:hypothetical protein
LLEALDAVFAVANSSKESLGRNRADVKKIERISSRVALVMPKKQRCENRFSSPDSYHEAHEGHEAS